MPPKPSPRSLPNASRRSGSFTPRRSYARARASRERVSSVDRILRNQRSQAKFARNLKLAVNVICILGILGLLIYTIFVAQKPDEAAPSVIQPPVRLK